MGVAAGDYDNDGWTDLFVTAVGQNTCSATSAAASTTSPRSAGVGGGGDHGARAPPGSTPTTTATSTCSSAATCAGPARSTTRRTSASPASAAPTARRATSPAPLRPSTSTCGNGRSPSAPTAAGLVGDRPGHEAAGRQVARRGARDLDDDGCVDLVVANDTVRNFVFRNRCDGTFEEIGTTLGLAFDSYGNARSGMGIDTADVRDDGALGRGHRQLRQRDDRALRAAARLRASSSTRPSPRASARRAARSLTFGLLFFDYDLDGRLDLLTTNGHVEDQIALVQASQQHAQPAQLFWNAGPEAPATFVPGGRRRRAGAAAGRPRRRLRRHRRRRRPRPAAGAGRRPVTAAAQRRAARARGSRMRAGRHGQQPRRGGRRGRR